MQDELVEFVHGVIIGVAQRIERERAKRPNRCIEIVSHAPSPCLRAIGPSRCC